MTLDMAYEPNKGGITTKTDIGTLNYSLSNKKYALSSINPSTGLITSAMNDSITYTSFESIKTITEGTYNATFTYNADNQRAKMTVLNGSSLVLSRWYPGSSYIRDSTSTGSKSFTFIGGDAYTAPVVAIKQGSGTPVYYYLLRDYLGSITHVINASNNTVAAEYSYDSWGRMRNPSTWASYAPGLEPDFMIADRGFTGHEHLKWFKLINMNGRVYDPLTGQFLSPDNYVQMPGFTQSYNRFTYCLNNPLKYTDPSGENWWNWLTAGIVGGVLNVINNWDNIDGDFIKFNQYAFAGCLAGSTASFLSEQGISAPLVSTAAGWILNECNAYIGGGNFKECTTAGAQGAASGFVGGSIGGSIGGGWGSLAGGAASNLTGQLLSNGGNFNDINWTSVGLSGASSFGLYQGMSYASWQWGGGNNLGGKDISYRQYCAMNADYQRSRFWQKENGGYLMTDGSVSRVPYADEHYLGVEFKNPPSGAWASYHTHWANPGTTYQVTLPNYDRATNLDILLGNSVSGVASQYHDAQDLTISGNTYIINRFDGSFHPYGATNYNVIAPDPFIRFYMFNWWW